MSYNFDTSNYSSGGFDSQYNAGSGFGTQFGAGSGSATQFGAGSGSATQFGAGSSATQFGAGSTATPFQQSGFSALEQAILRANNPLPVNETEQVTANGQSGILANREEIQNWRGEIPITQYLINEDPNPEIIRKKVEQPVEYDQEIAVRYLRPPTPPPPGEILIKQEKNIPTPPAPPLVIRQQPPRPETPAPLVLREAPPKPPAAVGPKVITISGKRLPPPPRKVIIERLAPLPSKPQSVMVERWLPYSQNKRRVIFQKNNEPDPIIAKPRNVIVQWEAPAVTIKKDYKDLGVIRANPSEYVQRYNTEIKASSELPQFVKEIRPPVGVVLAANYQAPSIPELEGDIDALKLIDLDREGLGEYRRYLGGYVPPAAAPAPVQAPAPAFNLPFSVSAAQVVNATLTELFSAVDINADGTVATAEAERVLLKLNNRLGRNFDENQSRSFFNGIDSNRDGRINLEEFKRAVLKDLNIN